MTASAVEAPASRSTTRDGLGYLAGLDGLRAVAVSAVFLFHAGVITGGFLGVDVFFVISGFLITALAIGEVERTGRLSLGHFWARRARRLLPALFLLCAFVVLWTTVNPPAPRALGRDVVSTLAYVANWTRVGDGYEYFAAYEEPSLLEHTWSLAVEEQFYLVWPLVIFGAVAVARRIGWSIRLVVGGVALAGAVGSTAWAWWLAGDAAELNRMYFGTDTRAVGLAVGCVAGCVLAKGAQTGRRRIGPAETGLAVAGLLVLVAMMALLDGDERWLYGPGFALAAIASLALVSAASGDGPIGRALSVAPLARMGRVSYGVYLWHWPVIILLDEEATGLDGPLLGALWVVATAGLVAASWWLVERPSPLPSVAHPVRAVAYAAACVAIGMGAVVVTRGGAPRLDPVAFALTMPQEPRASGPETPVRDEQRPTAVEEPAVDAGGTATVHADRPVRMLVLGDSVAESLGAGPEGPVEVGGLEVEVVNRSIIGCPVLWEGRWAYDDGRMVEDPPACVGDERFAEVVAEERPDLILLMFGWPGTIAGRQLDDGQVVAPCDPRFDQAYGDAYERLVERLEASAGVVVATVAPPTEFRDPGQSDRPGCLNRQIRQRSFDVVEFGEWLCPGGDCSLAEPLRRDPVHFAGTDAVRDVVWPALVRQSVVAAGDR